MHFAVGPYGRAQAAILHGAIDGDSPAGPDASFIDDAFGDPWETFLQVGDQLAHGFALGFDDLLAVGVCIDEMSEANGCLLIIPGSHKGPVLDHHLDGRFAGAVTDPDFDDSTAEKVELPAGCISLHHVRVLHGSLPNRSPNPRRLLLFEYGAGDAWPLRGSDWDGWCGSFVRGEPTKQPRLTAVPVRLALPVALRAGSIYENQSVLRGTTFKSAGG